MVKKEQDVVKKSRKQLIKKSLGGIKKAFRKSGSDDISGRSARTRRLLTAAGILQTGTKKKGAGRPKGTYKYGMPIHEYKKAMSRQKALFRQYQMQQVTKLRQKRGLTREQVQQLQMQRSAEEQPRQQFQKFQERQMQDPRRAQAQQVKEMADDEMEFRRWSAAKTVSPNTQRMLMHLRKVQNMGKVANIEQQRRIFERKLLSEHGNLMKAHENMTPVKLDFTGVSGDNILTADNVFKENAEDNILRSNKLNILQTREAGNSIGF